MSRFGTDISGVWCQDWQGVRYTSFGKRLRWNWKYDKILYPDLPREIDRLNKMCIGFMGYVNPYLCADGALFEEAEQKGLLARTSAAGPIWSISGNLTAASWTSPTRRRMDGIRMSSGKT
jgi:alpha-glucosidase